MDHVGCTSWAMPVSQEELERLTPQDCATMGQILEHLAPSLHAHLTDRRGHWPSNLAEALADASPGLFRSIVSQMDQEARHGVR